MPNTAAANTNHNKAPDHSSKQQPQKHNHPAEPKFKLDPKLVPAATHNSGSTAPLDFRLQFLESTRSTQLIEPTIIKPVDLRKLFAPAQALPNQTISRADLNSAQQRNETALAWYRSLHGSMQYALGENQVRPGGKGDCTALNEFIAKQYGHSDGVSVRWNTRTMWHTGYQMKLIGAHQILPGDLVVVPPRGISWPMNSDKEPKGVGHAGVFVQVDGQLKIMHASSIYGTVVLSSPEEFMQKRLGFKILRPQGQGRYAFNSNGPFDCGDRMKIPS